MAKTRRRGSSRRYFRFYGGSEIPPKPKPQCQCAATGTDKPCANPVVRGTVFCNQHQKNGLNQRDIAYQFQVLNH